MVPLSLNITAARAGSHVNASAIAIAATLNDFILTPASVCERIPEMPGGVKSIVRHASSETAPFKEDNERGDFRLPRLAPADEISDRYILARKGNLA